MGVHVFWDNSNIWGGAEATKRIKEPDAPWVAFRVYFRNLYKLVAKGRDVITRVLAGSVPPECEDLWEYARDLGFDTDLLRRVQQDDGRFCEQAVDEMLHLKISNAILDHPAPQTLVIMSGDGSESQFHTSFPKQVIRAIKNGWAVEVYSWGVCLNRRKYDPLVEQDPDKLKITDLEHYYESLTFIKGGEYYRKDENGKKIYFTVPKRVVSPLPTDF